MEKSNTKKAKSPKDIRDNSDGQFTYDTPFTLVLRGTPSNREIGRKETTLNKELDKARRNTADELLSEMILRRRMAIKANLDGLVDLLINELDERGMPVNTFSQPESAGKGEKVIPIISPLWIKCLDEMLMHYDDLESCGLDHEPVGTRQPYRSWRLKVGERTA